MRARFEKIIRSVKPVTFLGEAEMLFGHREPNGEVAMRIFLTAVSLTLLLSVGARINSARSEDASFKLTNSAPNIIHIKLFSQSRRGWQWPSSKRHWILDDGKQHT